MFVVLLTIVFRSSVKTLLIHLVFRIGGNMKNCRTIGTTVRSCNTVTHTKWILYVWLNGCTRQNIFYSIDIAVSWFLFDWHLVPFLGCVICFVKPLINQYFVLIVDIRGDCDNYYFSSPPDSLTDYCSGYGKTRKL